MFSFLSRLPSCLSAQPLILEIAFPPFEQNVDINELCSEFTKKARCDGTKVVLEPEGVNDIIESLATKRQN